VNSVNGRANGQVIVVRVRSFLPVGLS